MGTAKDGIGKALRLLASGGWADEDPDVLADLVRQGHQLASMVMADDSVSAELRTAAQVFLAQFAEDTFGQL
jgi:hypothetical protein